MRKILIPACILVWSGVAVYAVADVAVYDSKVETAVENADTHITDAVKTADSNITNAVNKQISGNNNGTYSPTGTVDEHGATEHGGVRANQVKQMDLMQGDRGKAETSGDIALDNAAKRDYLNLKPSDGGYAGSGSDYASSINLPSKYCSSIEATLVEATDGVPEHYTYACSGTSGYKGTSGHKSTDIRKELAVNFKESTNNSGYGTTASTGNKDNIDVEIGKATELYAQRVAIFQAMAQEAYTQTGLRYQRIQKYLDDIKLSIEPKDIMDLQGRMQGELVMLQNEQNQLLALSQLQNAERDMYEQKKIELNNHKKNPIHHSEQYSAKKVSALAAIGLLNGTLIGANDAETVDTALAVAAIGGIASSFD